MLTQRFFAKRPYKGNWKIPDNPCFSEMVLLRETAIAGGLRAIPSIQTDFISFVFALNFPYFYFAKIYRTGMNQARNTSATVQAWAKAPRGCIGGSPSKISLV
jgi:hypothetical protein